VAFVEVRLKIKQKDRRYRATMVIRDKKIKRLIVIGVIAIIAIGIGIVVATSKIPLQANAAPTIDGIQCNPSEKFVLHNHVHIDIFINGQRYIVPSQVGIIPERCIYWLHTHDDSGIIHIESPVVKNYTLGQFFDIWNKKFNNSQIIDNVANGKNNNTLSVYVNGQKVSSGANYRDINLNEHDQIAIVYGKPPTSIPTKYEFPKGL
jgi:hypothetical protein